MHFKLLKSNDELAVMSFLLSFLKLLFLPLKDLKVICYGAFYWLAMGIQLYSLLLYLLREICVVYSEYRLCNMIRS